MNLELRNEFWLDDIFPPAKVNIAIFKTSEVVQIVKIAERRLRAIQILDEIVSVQKSVFVAIIAAVHIFSKAQSANVFCLVPKFWDTIGRSWNQNAIRKFEDFLLRNIRTRHYRQIAPNHSPALVFASNMNESLRFARDTTLSIVTKR